MKDILTEASRRAIRYLEGIDTRSVAPTREAVANLKAFDEPLPLGPSSPEATLKQLDEFGSPATTAMAGRRFFGFVIGGALPVTLGANWLAGAWDQNSALYRATPSAAYIEEVALRWLLEILDLPAGCAGSFVTGATVANLCALAAARHAVLARAGWDVEANGLFGAPPITVIVGGEVHPSVSKSLGILGLGRSRVVKVPVDGAGRMIADKIPAISGPTIICAQAGNVNTGAFDPVAEICRRAKAAGAWVHVDGAFGLWAAATRSLRHLAAGIGLADSWATDAHKWLNVPYDCGLAFVRDPDSLRAAMAVTAEYLPTKSDFRNPADFTPELSRRARGRGLGRAPLPREDGDRRDDRAKLRPGPEVRREALGRRLRDPERGGAQPGAGRLRRCRPDKAGDRGDPGRGHVLVRDHGLAGQDRDEDQRVVVGHNDRGCRPERGGHGPGKPGGPSIRLKVPAIPISWVSSSATPLVTAEPNPMTESRRFRLPPLWLILGLAFPIACRAAEPSPIEPVTVKTVPETLFLCLSRDVLPGQIAEFVKEGTAKLRETVDAARLEATGPLQYMGPSWAGEGKVSTYILAVPVRERKPVPARFTWADISSHRVAAVRVHVPPATVAKAWEQLDARIAAMGLKEGPRWTEVQVAADGSLVEIQSDLAETP